MSRRAAIAAGLFVLLLGQSARPCTYCDPNFQRRQTLRQDARQAKLVLYGTLGNPRLVGERGMTDLNVEHAIKDDAVRDGSKVITVARYVPVDPKNPPRYVVFCDFVNGKLDPYRGTPVKGPAVVEYLRGSLALDDADRVKLLLYFFKHLDSPDADVALDAFLEMAKANDREIGLIAPKLDPSKLRKLLADPQTPPERLGLFAFLLGACGTKEDATLLATLLTRGDERTSAALSGLLGGYIELRPREGWDLAVRLLQDTKRPYGDRLAVLGTLRFYQTWKPAECRKELLRGLSVVLQQGDMADLAVEDLRRWGWWDLTKLVLAQYDKPSHAAPLVRRSLVRYALCCPTPEAVAFVKQRRAREPDVFREVEEGLQFERPPSK